MAASRTLLQRLLTCLNFNLYSEDLFCWYKREKRFLWIMAAAKKYLFTQFWQNIVFCFVLFFFQKKGFVTFLCLLNSNLKPKIRKSYTPIQGKSCYRAEFTGPSSISRGSINTILNCLSKSDRKLKYVIVLLCVAVNPFPWKIFFWHYFSLKFDIAPW